MITGREALNGNGLLTTDEGHFEKEENYYILVESYRSSL